MAAPWRWSCRCLDSRWESSILARSLSRNTCRSTLAGDVVLGVVAIVAEVVATEAEVVAMLALPEPIPMPERFEGLSEVLAGLLQHPQIQRLQLDHDPDNAWSVAAQLAQLLPIDEGIKYSLQGLESAEQLLEEMDKILTDLSGEPGS